MLDVQHPLVWLEVKKGAMCIPGCNRKIIEALSTFTFNDANGKGWHLAHSLLKQGDDWSIALRHSGDAPPTDEMAKQFCAAFNSDREGKIVLAPLKKAGIPSHFRTIFLLTAGFLLLLAHLIGWPLLYNPWVIGALSVVSTLVLFYEGWRFFKGMFKKPSMDTLISVVLLAAWASSLFSIAASFFWGQALHAHFHCIYWILGMHRMRDHISTFEDPLQKVQTNLKRFFPQTHYDGASIDCLEPNTELRLEPGAVVPCDGMSLEAGTVDRIHFLGSHQYHQVAVNEQIKAGDIVVGAPIQMKVRKWHMKSDLPEMLSAPLTEKTPQTEERWVLWFTIAVLIIALVTLGVWWGLQGLHVAMMTFMSTMVATCPCSLTMGLPALRHAMHDLYHKAGIFINNGNRLSQKPTHTFVDFAGTLTTFGKVAPIETTDTLNAWVHALQTGFLQQLQTGGRGNRALCARFINGLQPSIAIDPGKLTIAFDPATRQLHATMPTNDVFRLTLSPTQRPNGKHFPEKPGRWFIATLVCNGKEESGYYFVEETLKNDAIDWLHSLTASDKNRTHIVSGSSEPDIHALLETTNADFLNRLTVHADQNPNEKAAIIAERLGDRHHGLFIGDGANDGIALHHLKGCATRDRLTCVSLGHAFEADFHVSDKTSFPLMQYRSIAQAYRRGKMGVLIAAIAYNLVVVLFSTGLLHAFIPIIPLLHPMLATGCMTFFGFLMLGIVQMIHWPKVSGLCRPTNCDGLVNVAVDASSEEDLSKAEPYPVAAATAIEVSP